MTSPKSPSHLTRAELSTLRERLVAERKVLRETSVVSSIVTEAGPREADPSDEASDSLAQHEALAGGRRNQRHLAEVDAALARIEAGTYGISELSGEPIGFPRLTAVPWARFTVAEQEDADRAARG